MLVRFCLLFVTLCGSLLAGASSSTAAELQLVSLFCEESASAGDDYVTINAGGQDIWSGLMDEVKGENFAPLTQVQPISFSGSVLVSLSDSENLNDKLGRNLVSERFVGRGDILLRFNGNGGRYILKVRVTR